MNRTYDDTDFMLAWQELHLTPAAGVNAEDLQNEARGAWEAAGCPEPREFLWRWLLSEVDA